MKLTIDCLSIVDWCRKCIRRYNLGIIGGPEKEGDQRNETQKLKYIIKDFMEIKVWSNEFKPSLKKNGHKTIDIENFPRKVTQF